MKGVELTLPSIRPIFQQTIFGIDDAINFALGTFQMIVSLFHFHDIKCIIYPYGLLNENKCENLN